MTLRTIYTPAIDRKLAPGNYEVPFTEMVIQFTAPSPKIISLTQRTE